MRAGRALLIAGLVAATSLLVTPPTVADEPAPTERQVRFEIDFMTGTIDHHFMAVEMGEMCVAEATEPPPASDETLRDTCADIVAAQLREIDQLQSRLEDWYGIQKEPTMPPGGEQMMNRLERRHGEAFDIAVSRDFIRHHRTLLPDALRCTEVAAHEELRDLCRMMYETQRQEIGTFKEVISDHLTAPHR